MKTARILFLTLPLSALLLACSHNLESENSSAASSNQSSSVIDATNANTLNENEIVSGELTIVGQYKKDADLGTITLVKIFHPTTIINDQLVTIKTASVKIIKVHPTNAEQANAWQNHWSDNLEDPYYYVQLTMDITNKTGQDIMIEGLSSLVFNGRAYGLNDIADQTIGTTIPNSTTSRNGLVMFPIEKNAVNVTQLGFAFNDIASIDQMKVVVPVMNLATLDLTK